MSAFMSEILAARMQMQQLQEGKQVTMTER
jgi:hypothetical protein